jgi:hypothetical protein
MSLFRRGLMMGVGGKPYDAEVEYIQTDGNAYIDTGIKGASTLTFDLDFYIPTHSEQAFWVFGSRQGADDGQLCFINDAVQTSANPPGLRSWRFGSKNKTHTVYYTSGIYNLSNVDSSNTLKVGAESYIITAQTFTSDYNFYLFALNVSGTPSLHNIASGARFYGGKMYSSGVMVRDFIPVRKNGVGYLYDRVSGTLFGNANSTGSFAVGNDVPYNAEVEYIECDGSAYINTGVNTASTTSFDFSLYLPQFTNFNPSPWLFGSRSEANQGQMAVLVNSSSSSHWRYGTKSNISLPFLGGGDYLMSNVGDSQTLVVNGTSYSVTAQTFTTNYEFDIFCLNVNGTHSGFATGMRFKRGKMYQSGTLVRDYIPVRVGQIGYLYDKVSGTLFGNANNTGAFIIGNDK